MPVHHPGPDLSDRGIRTVIDDLAATRHGTGLQKINADTLAAPDDAGGIDAQAAELRDAHLGTVVLGKTGHESGIDAVVGQGHGDIGLAAAEGDVKLPGLTETQVAGSGKAKHHFAEGNYF